MTSTTPEHDDALSGVVAVGASAGGVEALTQLVAGLPADLPYAVVVVLHMPPNAPSVLASILDRAGPLRAVTATHGAQLEPGLIHVAMPDRHLLVDDHRLFVSEGPTENGYRPAINALFRSVALSYEHRAVGLLLSGVLDDGVLGSAAIRARGGTTVVQEPDDAMFPAMPLNALHAGVIDHRVAAAKAGDLLMQLAQRGSEQPGMAPKDRDVNMELENRIAMGPRIPSPEAGTLGPHSGYTCPDCHGSLQITSDNGFRCRVGHAWTTEALLQARDEEIDEAIWLALRSLREKAELARKMARTTGPGLLHNRYTTAAEEAERAVTVLASRLSQPTSDPSEHIGP
jgi:two-component system chemotaxis response regulator CheB